MSEEQIREILLKKGAELFSAPKGPIEFTHEPEADRLLNDLRGTPHAFVLACVMDRQMRAEAAWMIPYRFAEKLGDFEFETLRSLSLGEVESLMTVPTPLHRFPTMMSECFHSAVELVDERYAGDAGGIWADTPPSAEVVYRFLQFHGVGPKIASMAANILARDFKVPFSDYYSVDVSVDVQVRRVFARLGLTPKSATSEQVIYRARAINPQFPGLLDFPAWEIGRQWCRPNQPRCAECCMVAVCPAAAEVAVRTASESGG